MRKNILFEIHKFKIVNWSIYFSILLFISSCYSQHNKVGLQPYKGIPQSEIQLVKKTIEDVYGMHVVVLPLKEIPSSAFTNVKSPRYRADKLIKIQKEQRPDSLDVILGLTHFDISTTKKDHWGNTKKPEWKYQDWGIMGLGYRPGTSCIVSTYRVKSKNRSQYYDRLAKVTMHELGHTMGLPHCKKDNSCVMRDAAETVKTLDLVDLHLCNHCKRKVK